MENLDQDYFIYSTKIPYDRVKYLKQVLNQLKNKLNDEVLIEINDNEILIKSQDSWLAYKVKKVVEAIGRGFNIEKAELLLSDEYGFESLNISDLIRSKAPNQLERVRARIIGTKGRAKRNLEALGDCFIEVKGKTVSFISDIESINDVKEALEMLIRGSPHSRVYRWLEQKKKQRKFYSMLQNKYREY
jgi:ribosomal RNA assembly protein